MTSEFPPELINALEGEEPDLVIRSENAFPFVNRTLALGTGMFWLGVAGFFGYFFILPLFTKGFVNLTELHPHKPGDTPIIATWGHLRRLAPFPFLIGGAGLIGVWTLGKAVYMIFAKGNWYAITPNALIEAGMRKVRRIPWSDFTNEIEVRRHSEIILFLRDKEGRSRKKRRYDPEVISIVGIKNVREVTEVLQRRLPASPPSGS